MVYIFVFVHSFFSFSVVVFFPHLLVSSSASKLITKMHKSKISKISRTAADQKIINLSHYHVSSFDTWYVQYLYVRYDKYKLNDKNKYKITVYVYIQKQNNYIYIYVVNIQKLTIK